MKASEARKNADRALVELEKERIKYQEEKSKREKKAAEALLVDLLKRIDEHSKGGNYSLTVEGRLPDWIRHELRVTWGYYVRCTNEDIIYPYATITVIEWRQAK